MEYAVVIEKMREGYSAYLPDLPRCVAAAATRSSVLAALRTALKMHIAGMAADGIPLPKASALVAHLTLTPKRPAPSRSRPLKPRAA